MYKVYVLRSLKDNRLYYGHTEDITRRLSEHNSGSVKSTRNRRPLIVEYFEEVNTKEEAVAREKFFKSGFGRAYIKGKLININNTAPSSNG